MNSVPTTIFKLLNFQLKIFSFGFSFFRIKFDTIESSSIEFEKNFWCQISFVCELIWKIFIFNVTDRFDEKIFYMTLLRILNFLPRTQMIDHFRVSTPPTSLVEFKVKFCLVYSLINPIYSWWQLVSLNITVYFVVFCFSLICELLSIYEMISGTTGLKSVSKLE